MFNSLLALFDCFNRGDKKSLNKKLKIFVDIVRKEKPSLATLNEYGNFAQQDADEFLGYFLGDLAQTNLSKEKFGGQNSSSVDECDTFHLDTIYSNLSCNCGERKTESEENLYLPIPNGTSCTIEECLQHYGSVEHLETSCSGCKSKVQKHLSICSVSNYLILRLKRFEMVDKISLKLMTKVTIQTKLDLTNYIEGNPSSTKVIFRLVGVIRHFGQSLQEGHYVADINIGGKWTRCSDSTINGISTQEFLQNEETPYILFYKREESCANVDSFEDVNF